MLRSYSLPLIMLFASTVGAQVLYDVEIQPSEGVIFSIATLPDGTILSAGLKDGGAYLVNWNTQGDTLWTRHHPAITGNHTTMLRHLSTGELRISTPGQEHFFDLNGEHLWSTPGTGTYHAEMGPDSLLYIVSQSGEQRFQLRDRYANVIWTSEPIIYHPGITNMTMAHPIEQGILAYSLTHWADNTFNYQAVIRSRYGSDGTFQDSTLVYYSCCGITMARTIIPTMDGGSLAIIATGTTGFLMIRADASGEVLWTQHHGNDMNAQKQGLGVTELSDGRFIVSGHAIEIEDGNLISYPALMEMDSNGGSICTEHIGPGAEFTGTATPTAFAVVRTEGDTIHTTLGSHPTQPIDQHLIGHGPVYCLSTSIPSQERASLDWRMVDGGLWIDNTRAGDHWSMHSTMGQLVATGITTEGTTRMDLDLRGMYILTIDGPGADRLVGKVLIQ